MKHWGMLLMLAALPLAAEEVKAPVTGAMIFKNGVSAVRRTVDPGKNKEFDLACDIVPLQGSLWFSGPVVSVVRREVKKPVAGTYPLSNITKTYAGKTVTLTVAVGFNQPNKEITGEVWDPDAGKNEAKKPPQYEQNIWLKLSNGEFLMLQRGSIQSVRFSGVPQAAPLPEKLDRRPEWRFTLSEPASRPVLIDCLSRGLSWQSAYRIELGKENKMILGMDAEIVNNLADLENVPLYLASGYANFINANRQSPMAMVQPSEAVRQAEFGGFPNTNQVAMAEDAVGASRAYAPRMYKAAAPAEFGAEATGETEDISLTDVGKVTLKKGEVCHRVLKQAETSYERLVHWTIRARRNAEYGRPVGQGPSVPMDALRFTNPFDTPITTSPLEISDGGVVLAQVRIPWVNPKQVATVDVTRALSVTGKVVEYDVPAQAVSFKRAEEAFYSVQRNKDGKVVSGWIAGSRYRVTEVQGEIRLKNYRKLPARMLVEQDFVGELVSADGDPKKEILDRTGSVNPSARLAWDLTLAPDEEKVLKYRYSLFVNF